MLYIIIYMYLVYENKIHSLMHSFIHSFIHSEYTITNRINIAYGIYKDEYELTNNIACISYGGSMFSFLFSCLRSVSCVH
jgi:hypothetical protein